MLTPPPMPDISFWEYLKVIFFLYIVLILVLAPFKAISIARASREENDAEAHVCMLCKCCSSCKKCKEVVCNEK